MARALDLVGNKWTVPIIRALSQSETPVRFRELQRGIGVTQKELTRHLRRLERAKLLTREVFPEVPPRVQYALTELGRSLVPPLVALGCWASEHGAALEAFSRISGPSRIRRGKPAAD